MLEDNFDDYEEIVEQLTGNVCPVCGFPTVTEEGLEVCYKCGWYEGSEQIGYYEQ